MVPGLEGLSARTCREVESRPDAISGLWQTVTAEVFRKYLELTSDKTVIFVTHRISVAALAERIIVFDDGKIVEEGSHHELLTQDGKYATLYREQAKWYNR